tara:strand:+ start:2811 stop:3620 length:810 start_codon:yes stop_codon:yes gene_type:complete
MIVVKIGGASGINTKHIIDDITKINKSGSDMLVVHGGSELATNLGKELNYPPKFVTSPSGHTSRYTDKRTLDIFVMATSLINRNLVRTLQESGVNAIGISGIDGKILSARRKSTLRIVENGKQKIIRDDYTGKITCVNIMPIKIMQNADYLPVMAPIAISHEKEILNVDGDRAAAELAGKLNAKSLVILSNVSGLLSDIADPNSYIPKITGKQEIEHATNNIAQGRMKRKLIAANEALSAGVDQVIIANANIKSPITNALQGKGTIING